ncbi:MAG TPA: universal stress protein, partial [Parvularculaceae bacterium]|nr:universal stress protein [Parvularculaceae bacterium]
DLEPIRHYLDLHGVDAKPGSLRCDGEGVAEKILAESENLAAAFIVMGAFSSAPWQEQLFGGATHAILRGARKPVLLSH